MRFDVVTIFPEFVKGAAGYGVTGKAINNGIVDLVLWNPRDYAKDGYKAVDDRPYGGGPGMVMMVQPLRDAIEAARADSKLKTDSIFLTPQGQRLTQTALNRFAESERLTLIAGRYEGIDERLIESDIDEEWSLGDYVLSGGELAVLVVIDAVTRLLPGVLGDDESARNDSFMQGLLDYPHYTRPLEIDGSSVPGVLRSGNHREINRWRMKQSLGRTAMRRPDLLTDYELTNEQQQLLDEYETEMGRYKGDA